MFNPADLQVELAPVPASTIGGVIERELPRGTVDLVHGLGERIRLLLAIPDLDYRPDLLDLPARDTALEDELFRRAGTAVKAWSAWWQQWQLLFGGLTEEDCRLNQAPQYRLGLLPVAQSRPSDPDRYRDYLFTDKLPIQEPYASHLLNPHMVDGYTKADDPATPAEQLLMQREKIREDINKLKMELDEGYGLLNEMNDYLKLQRQQLDSLTISFSALAGGIPGDGSGSGLMRWSADVAFNPNGQETKEG